MTAALSMYTDRQAGRPEPHAEALLVGLMSGTSLDGITAALVRFSVDSARIGAELLHHVQLPYDDAMRSRLLAAMASGSARDYCTLDADMGDLLGAAALEVMRKAGVQPSQVTAVASHGHTIWHEPGHSTWQTGNAARIAELTGCSVVSDFRARDVAVGGQGAPLVPMADMLLFAHPHEWRAMQNLGGIGNVTLVPPQDHEASVQGQNAHPSPDWHSAHFSPQIQAFDTGPGVVIIDAVAERLFGRRYDPNGRIAATGKVLDEVITEMLGLPFLALEPPKSTGRELFSDRFITQFVSRCESEGAAPADVLATACAFTAACMADQYVRWFRHWPGEVVVSGGGARNAFLIRCIRERLALLASSPGRAVPKLSLFDESFFDAEAKEAVAFALLGYLHLSGRAGNVPAATGARVPRVLGVLTPAARA